MKTKKIILSIALALFMSLFTGCTAKAWYKGGQYGAEHNCRNQPAGAIEQCLENLNKRTYKEYEKER
ncbi:hypothetical protein [Sulfurimonas sp.]|uniref:hypothetical protein n=1 Tax=Sulfurimonas sp. TaxID=2022749 RepID=UPI002B47240F|nr:hypothetical protein [Sulfurimonas sp.]